MPFLEMCMIPGPWVEFVLTEGPYMEIRGSVGKPLIERLDEEAAVLGLSSGTI
jgi:hypothetical protein